MPPPAQVFQQIAYSSKNLEFVLGRPDIEFMEKLSTRETQEKEPCAPVLSAVKELVPLAIDVLRKALEKGTLK
jgi:hypothetical protein